MKALLIFIFFSNFIVFSQELSIEKANTISKLPYKCMQREYPNKLNQTLLNNSEIKSPKVLHPAFYGCFDWHSSIHGHWSLVYLLKNFPQLASRDSIIIKLQTNLSSDNIQQEIAYFNLKHEKSFERTYGWNWLLKLQLELETTNEPFAKETASNLLPLTNLICQRYIEFLPKLLYPVRAGTHNNTAFGLSFAFDYAVYSKNIELQNSIKTNAKRLFLTDSKYALQWEPSGTDFLSPCLEEIGLMQRILPENEFLLWVKKFLPEIFKKKFQMEVAKVSDREDGHLVHLDGLNFSRAWNLYRLIKKYPKQFSHLKLVADTHFNFSLPTLMDGNYEGEHWLASFALKVFEERNNIGDY